LVSEQQENVHRIMSPSPGLSSPYSAVRNYFQLAVRVW
jgi:hypothetical protein